MKCLQRNLVKFYYAPYLRKEKTDKGYGYKLIYGEPVECYGNISPATGNTSAEQFGNNVEYDKVIVLDDPNIPVDESTVFFIEVTPQKNADDIYIYDYIVKKIARSLNSVSIAISKVKVS